MIVLQTGWNSQPQYICCPNLYLSFRSMELLDLQSLFMTCCSQEVWTCTSSCKFWTYRTGSASLFKASSSILVKAIWRTTLWTPSFQPLPINSTSNKQANKNAIWIYAKNAEGYIFLHCGLKIAHGICLGLYTKDTGLNGMNYKLEYRRANPYMSILPRCSH